jgi:tetratricopeptide (TPR) repeat protein
LIVIVRTGITGMFIAALFGYLAQVAAAENCEKDCLADIACEVKVVDCLIEANDVRQAIKRLKILAREHADQPAYLRLLARAYLADNNSFWAQRTLQKALARDGDDLDSRFWLAWVYVNQGDLELARDLLAEKSAPRSGPEQARWMVMHGFMARTENEHEVARLALQAVEEASQIYPEDMKLWEFLRRVEDPGFIEPLNIRLELWGGYTSNAQAGSPTDPSQSGSKSALGRLDLFTKFVWPAWQSVRPTIEGSFKGHALEEDAAPKSASRPQEYTYLELTLRPGVIIGYEYPRILVGYKAELLLINQDEKNPFYEAHRGEIEIETGGPLVFAGAGRRIFRESGRTRWEFDGGAGGAIGLHPRVQLLLAGSARYFLANSEPYDQVGATAIVVGRILIWKGISLRLGVNIGLDYYLHSDGPKGEMAFGIENKKRFDILTKLSAGLWSPLIWSTRFGIGYEYSIRNSSADSESDNYNYTEQRALLKARWVFDINPWAPGVVEPQGHVALDYGLGGDSGGGLDQERIQDLLRQDEAARRGSSCID